MKYISADLSIPLNFVMQWCGFFVSAVVNSILEYLRKISKGKHCIISLTNVFAKNMINLATPFKMTMVR